MRLSDYAYELPEQLIAQFPSRERADARLLAVGPRGTLHDARIGDLVALVEPNDLMVFNDTRVIPARLLGRKPSGGRVELLVERILDAHRLLAHARASKALKPGGSVLFGHDAEAKVCEYQGALVVIELGHGLTADALLRSHGQIPLPPYIRRDPQAIDLDRYQTVYARREGAVAAPTAGLHFDRALLERLRERGVRREFITLHVGAGTFQPVRCEHPQEHRMHAERVEVSQTLCDAVVATRVAGGRIIAVGTTCVRALESAAASGELRPFAGDTQLFIYPGYRFRCVDALVTNFHLPRSTLLMLVCAFAGTERVLGAYRHAVSEEYRFFSYGDAMWLTRDRR